MFGGRTKGKEREESRQIGEKQLLGTEGGLRIVLTDHINKLQTAALHHHWGLSHPL